MTLSEYKQTMRHPLRARTATFLLKDNLVLLGYKKQGFGMGKFLGIGGKVESGKSIEEGAKREVFEEIGVAGLQVKHSGILSFYFPHIHDESWNQEVHVFIATVWQGIPKESEEIRPEWFAISMIPYEKMWDDARRWMPQILQRENVHAEFLFDNHLKVIDYNTRK